MQAGSRRPQGGRKGPIYPRLTTASLVVGLVGIALIAFAQWLRWMGGRGDPLHWAERTENILPLALPANEPCASRSGFGLPVCANATAGAHVQYLYPLVNAPYTGAFRAPAVTHLDVVLSDAIPEQSVIVSIHQQEAIIRRNLGALLRLSTGSWELIVTFDGCTDGSVDEAEAAVREFLIAEEHAAAAAAQGGAKVVSPECRSAPTRIRLVEQTTPVWETSSDNIGLRAAYASSFLILVQADVLVTEVGWNRRLVAPLLLFGDLFAVSARAAHNIADGRGSHLEPVSYNLSASAMLEQEPTEEFLREELRSIHIRDTVNRGPLALRANVTRQIGFLDEQNFHIDNDEHDMILRVHAAHGLKAARFAVGFYMPKQDSTTRKYHKMPPLGRFKEWLFLVSRSMRSTKRVFRKNKAVFGAAPNWNEERPVNAEQLATVWRPCRAFIGAGDPPAGGAARATGAGAGGGERGPAGGKQGGGGRAELRSSHHRRRLMMTIVTKEDDRRRAG